MKRSRRVRIFHPAWADQHTFNSVFSDLLVMRFFLEKKVQNYSKVCLFKDNNSNSGAIFLALSEMKQFMNHRAPAIESVSLAPSRRSSR